MAFHWTDFFYLIHAQLEESPVVGGCGYRTGMKRRALLVSQLLFFSKLISLLIWLAGKERPMVADLSSGVGPSNQLT